MSMCVSVCVSVMCDVYTRACAIPVPKAYGCMTVYSMLYTCVSE